MDHLLSMEKADTEVFIKETDGFYLVLRDRNISQKVDLWKLDINTKHEEIFLKKETEEERDFKKQTKGLDKN